MNHKPLIRTNNIYIHQMGRLLRCTKAFRTIVGAVRSGEFGPVIEIRFRRASGLLNVAGNSPSPYNQINNTESFYQPEWETVYKDDILSDLETLFLITGPIPLQSVSIDQYELAERSQVEAAFVFSNGYIASYMAGFSSSGTRDSIPYRTLKVTFEKRTIQILFTSPSMGGIPDPCPNRQIVLKQWPNNLRVRVFDHLTNEYSQTVEKFPVFSSFFDLHAVERTTMEPGFEGNCRFFHNS